MHARMHARMQVRTHASTLSHTHIQALHIVKKIGKSSEGLKIWRSSDCWISEKWVKFSNLFWLIEKYKHVLTAQRKYQKTQYYFMYTHTTVYKNKANKKTRKLYFYG